MVDLFFHFTYFSTDVPMTPSRSSDWVAGLEKKLPMVFLFCFCVLFFYFLYSV